MWEPFTEGARRVIVLAQEEAARLGVSQIGVEHLLVGILEEGKNVASEMLAIIGITLWHAQTYAAKLSLLSERGEDQVFSASAKASICRAFEEARSLGHNYIGPEHLLLAFSHLNEMTGISQQAGVQVSYDELLRPLRSHVQGKPGCADWRYSIEGTPIPVKTKQVLNAFTTAERQARTAYEASVKRARDIFSAAVDPAFEAFHAARKQADDIRDAAYLAAGPACDPELQKAVDDAHDAALELAQDTLKAVRDQASEIREAAENEARAAFDAARARRLAIWQRYVAESERALVDLNAVTSSPPTEGV